MSAEAREAMLKRVRSALGGSAATEATVFAEWEEIPREYEQAARLSPEDRLELLEDRLRDYDAEVTRVGDSEVAAAISEILLARGNPRMLVPAGFPAHWAPADVVLTEDTGFTPRELDGFDGVLTSATVAIADTGSLVLQNVPGQGRRAATLVPDFHLCVVRVEDVVENVPESFARLGGTAMLPTTFVSGPSATADIEMTRIKGVHGPRFLHVLLATRGCNTNDVEGKLPGQAAEVQEKAQ
jgi:L-lactate dehydrogenase complex protein LldG